MNSGDNSQVWGLIGLSCHTEEEKIVHGEALGENQELGYGLVNLVIFMDKGNKCFRKEGVMKLVKCQQEVLYDEY